MTGISMRWMMTLFLSAFLLIGSARGEEAAWPPEVRELLDHARRECVEAGGKTVTFPKTIMRKIDLNGDGRPDYVVDLQDTECDEALSLYCGTAGCNVDILITGTDGKLTSVFSQRIRQYEILPGRGVKRVRFHLHGGYCGRGGTETCVKTRRMTGAPFEFKEPD
jgi:hypothetical protein